MNPFYSLVLASFLVAGSAKADPICSEDFSYPAKQNNTGASGYLGAGGTGFSYNSKFGTWLYVAANMGVNDSAEGLGDGSSAGNEISSIGHARVQDVRGPNARALSVVFYGRLFTHGTKYTVSFDVIGDASGNDTGRYWLAEVYGYDYDGSNYIQIDGTQAGWASAKPFTAAGSATVNYLKDSADNGVLIEGENATGTTSVSFTFTYDGSNKADIAFAVGTYNNIFAIDNVKIVPE